MKLTRRSFLGGSAVLATAAILPFPAIAKAVEYIDPEWRKLVAMQAGNPNGTAQMLYYLDYRAPHYDPTALTEIFYGPKHPGPKMELRADSMPIGDDQFIYAEAEIALAVKETVRSFPHHMDQPWKREIDHVFDCRANMNQIAQLTRRGRANTHMYDTWYYRGANMLDAPFFIIHKEFRGGTRYAIVKHPKFEKYGFHMTKQVPDGVGYSGSDPKGNQRVYGYEVSRYEKDDMIFHDALPKPLRKIKA